MSKKQSKRSNLKILTFDNDDEIPSYIRNQILALDDKLSSLISGYCREIGRSGCKVLKTWNQFWTNGSNLVLLVDDPDDVDMLYDESKVEGYLLYNKNISDQDGTTCIDFVSLWIEPEFRELHSGSVMVRKVFDMNPNASYEVMVMSNNKVAQSFWKSVGFVTPVCTSYFIENHNERERYE